MADQALEIHYLTLFPEVFPSILGASLLGKAQERGLARFQVSNIRDFAQDKHRTVDDTPYGGGEGMLLKADVLYDAWKGAMESFSASGTEDSEPTTVLLSPQGELLTQNLAKQLVAHRKLVFVCGHYEGVDERFIECCVDREVSVGDYVLTGGELPALVLTDVLARLIPGVVGKAGSVSGDSLEENLLKYPQYTRPREFQGLEVPEVLLTGNHEQIARWRRSQSLERTARKRPDLWEKASVKVLERPPRQ